MAIGTPSLVLFVCVSITICLLHLHQVDAVKPIPRSEAESSRILQDSIVRLVNGNPRAGWKAAASPRFANYTVGQFKHILGVKPMPQNAFVNVVKKTHSRNLELPKEFDAREAWSQCHPIRDILDQGHCGSCWAFAAVESLSDRFCIHLNLSVKLSVNDLLACCGFMCGDGCDGGWPYQAWQYFVGNGVVTSECDPYFDDVGCGHPGCEPTYPTPRCEKKCQVKNQIWEESKHYGVNAYYVDSDPYNIMAEIYKNGPVEVDFTVYEDFAHYKSGVYRHITGDVMGGHAVKLIGWGASDDGEDYWLIANQWNRGWGDDGYFKIIRGTNECGIEEDVVAGLPSSKNLIKIYASGDADSDAAI